MALISRAWHRRHHQISQAAERKPGNARPHRRRERDIAVNIEGGEMEAPQSLNRRQKAPGEGGDGNRRI